MSTTAEQALLDYDWPGNVRELKHSVEGACILSHNQLVEPDAFFDEGFMSSAHAPEAAETPASDGTLTNFLRDCERKFIPQSLGHNQWHFGNTTTALGIRRKTLWEKVKKLDIHADKHVEI